MQSHSLKFKIILTDWGILGREAHAMWWVEYILNAIVAAAEREGAGEAEDPDLSGLPLPLQLAHLVARRVRRSWLVTRDSFRQRAEGRGQNNLKVKTENPKPKLKS